MKAAVRPSFSDCPSCLLRELLASVVCRSTPCALLDRPHKLRPPGHLQHHALIFVVKDENFANIIAVIAVSSVNVYVQITSVLLATLWCSATRPEVSSGYPGDSRSRLRESVPRMQFVPRGLVSLPTRPGVQVTRTSSLEELA